LDASPARRAAAELLPRVAPVNPLPFCFLHAWTLAHDKRFAPAAATMRAGGVAFRRPHMAAEAVAGPPAGQAQTETKQAQAGENTGRRSGIGIRLAEQAAIALTLQCLARN
jgi:hypothetical protein